MKLQNFSLQLADPPFFFHVLRSQFAEHFDIHELCRHLFSEIDGKVPDFGVFYAQRYNFTLYGHLSSMTDQKISSQMCHTLTSALPHRPALLLLLERRVPLANGLIVFLVFLSIPGGSQAVPFGCCR